jgi:(1->4)-alpha-D-glucan 1-alpha-D-glucosylmutase
LVDDLETYGQQTSLAQTLIKLTAPGIPDLYQGTELWNFSVVDPDNRRPIDYDMRRRLLLHELPGLSPVDIWQRRQKGCRNYGLSSKAFVFGVSGHRHLAPRDIIPRCTRKVRSPHMW